MSGILGFYSEDNLSEHHVILDEMQSAIAHRGPDGLGHWTDGAVAIGHQRFVTTPEAQYERSPHSNARSNCVITADVRLDNRDELIETLNLDSLNGKELTDPDLVLEAYQRWGNDCPDKLLGAFAFIIWDPQRQTYFGARDHMGVKPFYYSHQEKFFAFASEIKALLRSPQISNDLDETRITSLLTSELNDRVRTCYVDISRLPAAHWIEFSPHSSLKIHAYWQLDPHREIQLQDDTEYIQKFRAIFDKAVRCRLRRQVPIGSHLSGGMDSSSIAVTAQHLMSQEDSQDTLKTFSATFSSVPDCDESDYIREILNTGNFESHFIAADQTGPLSHWQQLFEALDEPALGNGYLTWLMNREAQNQGIKILLNGYDGDTTVGHGTLYPNELAKAGHWKAALEESKLLAQRFSVEGITPLTLMRRTSYEVLNELRQEKRWIKILTAIPKIFRPLKLSPFHLAYIFFLRPFFRNLIGKKSQHIEENSRNRDQFKIINATIREKEFKTNVANSEYPANKVHYQTVRLDQWSVLSSGMMTFPMELLDQISAPLQIEPRFPLMDKRLVEFCLALPPDQKLRQGWTRFILRNSMSQRLPKNVQWRETKTDLTQAFNHGLDTHNQEILKETLIESTDRIQDWIDLPHLRKMISKGLSSQVIQDLWPVITLSLWLKGKHQAQLNPIQNQKSLSKGIIHQDIP